MICICIPVFIGFLFETTYQAKILFVEHEIHILMKSCLAIWLLMGSFY